MIKAARAEGYCIRIELIDVQPTVWRTMNVPAGLRLDEFSVLLLIAMGWEGSHLHQFRIGHQIIGHFADHEDDSHLPEKEVFIEDLFGEDESRLIFEYDFGDGWEHEITLIRELNAEDDLLAVIDGERACPPEDCGGPAGYADLLSILSNPEDPEYEEMLEWVGDDFDPEKFDIEKTNEILATLAEDDLTYYLNDLDDDDENFDPDLF
jgi:hypothetical protein